MGDNHGEDPEFAEMPENVFEELRRRSMQVSARTALSVD